MEVLAQPRIFFSAKFHYEFHDLLLRIMCKKSIGTLQMKMARKFQFIFFSLKINVEDNVQMPLSC